MRLLARDWDSCGDSAIQLAGKVIRRSFVTNNHSLCIPRNIQRLIWPTCLIGGTRLSSKWTRNSTIACKGELRTAQIVCEKPCDIHCLHPVNAFAQYSVY